MKFYYINADTPEGMPYVGTLDAAKRLARTVAEDSYEPVNVHHVEVATHRDAILNLLNIGPGAHDDLGIVYTAKAKKKD